MCATLPSARLCERRDYLMDEELPIQRRLAAILAADIAGYSRLMHEDESATVRDLKGHQSVILPLIGRHGGRIIDTAGDGIMAEFPSVTGATAKSLPFEGPSPTAISARWRSRADQSFMIV